MAATTKAEVFALALREIARITREVRILDRERKPLDCTAQAWVEELGRRVDKNYSDEVERKAMKPKVIF